MFAVGSSRTYKNILENLKKWENSGGDLKNRKKYECCHNTPVLKIKEDYDIIELFPPPELHLMIGVVNGIFKALEKKYSEVAVNWSKVCYFFITYNSNKIKSFILFSHLKQECHVEKDILFGGSFNGNSCRKLLKNLDKLKENLPLIDLDFFNVFKSFNDVVNSHFGLEYKKDNAEKNIKSFKTTYEKLCNKYNISCTPKVHAVLHHVPEFCSKMNVGLGIFNEQAFESVHADFKNTWSRFKRSPENPNYSAKLLRAVCVYNANHVSPDS